METSHEWNTKQIILLIQRYREKQLLWDPKHEHYKDRDKRHYAMCDIADSLRLSKHQVEKKIKNIVGQFGREMRQMREKAQKGMPDPYKSKWFAFKYLSFLIDRYRPRPRYGKEVDEAVESIEFNTTGEYTFLDDVVTFDENVQSPESEQETKRRKTEELNEVSERRVEIVRLEIPDETVETHEEEDAISQIRLEVVRTEPTEGTDKTPEEERIDVSERRVEIPEKRVDFLEKSVQAPGRNIRTHEKRVGVSKRILQIPARAAETPENIVNVPESRVEVPEKAGDAFSAFGHYVAEELKDLKHERTIALAKFKISEVLYKAKCGVL